MSGMDRLTELLPCPFCGGTNQTRVEGDRFWCHAIMCPCGLDYSGGDELAGCIAAWNRRASQAAPSDGLREAAAHANSWLRAALHCKEWQWDADQRAIAEVACNDLRIALTPAPAQEGGE